MSARTKPARAIRVTSDDKAKASLVSDPLALLIGMPLDHHIV